MYIAKTKMLISCAVTAQLICVFVFAYAQSRISNDVAHIIYKRSEVELELLACKDRLLCIPLLLQHIITMPRAQ